MPKKTRYLLPWFLCWLPAFVWQVFSHLFPAVLTPLSPSLQFFIGWTAALIFIIGWCGVWGYLGYDSPLLGLVALFFFAGISLFLAALAYTRLIYRWLPAAGHVVAGLFSYTPLAPLATLLKNGRLPYELVLILFQSLLYLLAWMIGNGVRKGLQGYR